MLFTSPRYSTLAQVNLINAVSCRTLLVPEAMPPAADLILEAARLRVFHIPSIEELFDRKYPYYRFERSFEQARHEPLVALHTSGTAGLPKPIIWTHEWAASFAQERRLSPPAGFESSDSLLYGNRVLSLMPPFHVSWIQCQTSDPP